MLTLWDLLQFEYIDGTVEDIVAAEAVRRLLFVHRMDEETINRTKVLPRSVQSLYKILRNRFVQSLFHFTRLIIIYRTYPDLDTLFPRDPPLPALPLDEWWQANEESTLEDRVREQTLLICHRIDCQGIMCPTHCESQARKMSDLLKARLKIERANAQKTVTQYAVQVHKRRDGQSRN